MVGRWRIGQASASRWIAMGKFRESRMNRVGCVWLKLEAEGVVCDGSRY